MRNRAGAALTPSSVTGTVYAGPGASALAAAMRVGRDSWRGQLSVADVLALAVGALPRALAAGQPDMPPVRATGVTANAVFPADSPPRDAPADRAL